MSEIIEKYLSQEQRTKKTLRYYNSILNGFNDWLKKHRRNMTNFTADNVETYYKEKVATGEWSTFETVGVFLKIIRSFCNWEIENLEDKIIGTRGVAFDSIQRRINKLKKVKKVKGVRMIHRIKTNNPVLLPELKKIFELMLDDVEDPKHWNFMTMYTLAYWGIRPGDLHATGNEWIKRPDMLNEIEGRVVLLTAKTRSEYLSFYDGGIMSDIIQQFNQDPKLFTVTAKAMWQRGSKYSELFGKKIYPKLGREAFNTHMGFDDNHPLYIKHKIHLDDNFTKVLVGHSARMINITERYKVYPELLIKDAMTKYHYLKPLDNELRKLI